MAASNLPTRRKQSTEKRTITFDFTQKLAAGDTVSSISSLTAAAGLTISAGTLVGNQVSCQVSSGVDGSDYRVQCRVNTTLTDILELDVVIEVRADAN
jgi:hypothetical protein